jgi:UDP-glucose 4-epimerase
MRILITGGTGFVGSHLAEAFLDRGDRVDVLDIGSMMKVKHLMEREGFTLYPESIFNQEMLDSLVMKADLIYHLAAVVGVEHYVADPYAVLNVNVNGTQSVLQTAHKYGKKVVFASTSEVYGRNPKVPWAEDDDRVLGSTRIDRWCYSTSKAVGEHFCWAYAKKGLSVVVTRYFNAYGPRLDAVDVGRVITIFMGQVLRNEPVTVIGDGSQTRCFTYISDTIRATVEAGLNPAAESEIVNIGNDRETTILELAETMIRISGATSQVKLVKKEDVYGESYEDIQRRVPDITKMKTLLKVSPEVGLDEGLKHTIDWFRANTKI